MNARVARWGDSLALRIPGALALELAVEEGAELELTVSEGRLVAEPRPPEPHFDLAELLAGVTPENIHGEITTGPALGSEFS